MKKLYKLLSAVLVAFTAFSYTVLPASAASLEKVANLQAYKTDDDEVNLKWSKVAGADGYQVYVYNENTSKWKKLATTSKTVFEADDLASAKKYKFRVRAYDKKTSGTVYSAYANVTAATVPDEVENLRVSAKTKNSVTLKWTAVKRATGYQVYLYNASKGKYMLEKSVTGTSAKITGLKEGTSYKVKVRAYFKLDGKNYNGEFSDVVSAKTTGKAAAASNSQDIGKSKAEAAALNHAGLKKGQVKFFECKLDRENGINVYEVEFDYGGYEYEYEINAQTGKIISVEKSRAD